MTKAEAYHLLTNIDMRIINKMNDGDISKELSKVTNYVEGSWGKYSRNNGRPITKSMEFAIVAVAERDRYKKLYLELKEQVTNKQYKRLKALLEAKGDITLNFRGYSVSTIGGGVFVVGSDMGRFHIKENEIATDNNREVTKEDIKEIDTIIDILGCLLQFI